MSTQLKTFESQRKLDLSEKNATPDSRRGFRAGSNNILNRTKDLFGVENASLLRDVKECLDVLDLRLVEQNRSFAGRFHEVVSRSDESRAAVDRSMNSIESHIQKFHESFLRHKQGTALASRDFGEKIAALLENEAASRKRSEARVDDRFNKLESVLSSSSKPIEEKLNALEDSIELLRRSEIRRSPHLSLVDDSHVQEFLRKTEEKTAKPKHIHLHQNIFFGLVIFLQLTVAGMLLWQSIR